MNNKPNISEFIPLLPQQLYILLSLIDGERHGYAIMRDIEDQTNGEYRIPIASLYRHIDNMDKDGWIEWTKDRPFNEGDDSRRRYYRMTPLGREICRSEMQRLTMIVNSHRGILSLGKNPVDT